ncbi:gas vesicle protein [Streptomyces sp. NPDC021749]|uniref:gas vesicle protein GvpO n=1 Tax=Streptomyces sp. NPDC021749 TaxID=3154905 RepID=UPI0033CF6CB1
MATEESTVEKVEAGAAGEESLAPTETETASGGPDRIAAPAAMRLAAGQLAEMLNCAPGSVSALKADGDGWLADVEVVELERVPDTASVMASYRVRLDEQGHLMEYARMRRYGRGQIDR